MTTQPNKEAPKFSSFAELAKAAKGEWPAIFSQLAPELDLAQQEAPYHVGCPIHGGVDGFRLFADFADTGGGFCNTCGAQASGFSMLKWLKGYHIRDAAREVAALLGDADRVERPVGLRPSIIVAKPKDLGKARQYIRQIWTATKPLAGSFAEDYLRKRGIWPENMSPVLRAHPGLKYFHGKEMTCLGTFPSLIAPVKTLTNEIVAVHRTYLTAEGTKADVPNAKKITAACGELRGASIQLFPAAETLGVTEGLETALAVHAITRMPVWAGVSAVLMELMDFPPCVKHVVIWGDKDISKRGEHAAEKLAARCEAAGITVEVYMPPIPIPEGKKGIDWLDMLETHGIFGFPAKWRKWRPSM
ncbi:MAG: toprim domain-containing protein [Agitococcus sp.]|nr:toprim domain-containing protein [Agitococcus sp.]